MLHQPSATFAQHENLGQRLVSDEVTGRILRVTDCWPLIGQDGDTGCYQVMTGTSRIRKPNFAIMLCQHRRR